jgi:hypothetical protein
MHRAALTRSQRRTHARRGRTWALKDRLTRHRPPRCWPCSRPRLCARLRWPCLCGRSDGRFVHRTRSRLRHNHARLLRNWLPVRGRRWWFRRCSRSHLCCRRRRWPDCCWRRSRSHRGCDLNCRCRGRRWRLNNLGNLLFWRNGFDQHRRCGRRCQGPCGRGHNNSRRRRNHRLRRCRCRSFRRRCCRRGRWLVLNGRMGNRGTGGWMGHSVLLLRDGLQDVARLGDVGKVDLGLDFVAIA